MTAAIARFLRASFDRPEPPTPTLNELCYELSQQPYQTPNDELRANARGGPLRIKTKYALFTNLDKRDRHQQNAYDLVRASFYATAKRLTDGIQDESIKPSHSETLRKVWDEHGLCEKPEIGSQIIRLRQVFVLKEQLVLTARRLGLKPVVAGPELPTKASSEFVHAGHDPRYVQAAIRAEDFVTREHKYGSSHPL